MARQTQIETAIAVDAPLVQDAKFRIDSADRQYIDSQIRGCERHLVDSLLSGVTCTWQGIDSTSAALAVGDVAVPTTVGKVAKATAALLAAAGSAYGIAVTPGAPGGKVRVATAGRVPRTVTGLAAGAPGLARVNTTTGRLERVAAYVLTDWPVGLVDAEGTVVLTLPLAQVGAVAPGVGLPTGPSNVLFVDKAGSDASAVRGDSSHPYLTLTAALAAMQSGDQVRMGPGTWAERVTITGPANVSIIGSGKDVTYLDYGDGEGEPTLIVVPSVAMSRLLISGMTVTSNNSAAITINGGDFPASIEQVIVRDIKAYSDPSSGCEFNRISALSISGCWFDKLRIGSNPKVMVDSCWADEGIYTGWQDGDTVYWGSASNATQLVGCEGSNLHVSGGSNVVATGCEFGGTTLERGFDSTEQGTLVATGCKLTGLTVSAMGIVGDDVAKVNCCDMTGIVATRSSGATRVTVSAHGSSLTGTAAGSTSAGDGCDINIRDSHFVQASLAATGDGTIERSRHRQAIALQDGSPVAVTFAVPFKTAGYSVAYEQATIVVAAVATTAKSATGFSATANGEDLTASFMILHD